GRRVLGPADGLAPGHARGARHHRQRRPRPRAPDRRPGPRRGADPRGAPVILVLIILAVLVGGRAAAAPVMRTGGPGGPAPVTAQPFEPLRRGGVEPEGRIELRSAQVLRGYRRSQVDDVLDQLSEELRARDAEIAQLRAELSD